MATPSRKGVPKEGKSLMQIIKENARAASNRPRNTVEKAQANQRKAAKGK